MGIYRASRSKDRKRVTDSRWREEECQARRVRGGDLGDDIKFKIKVNSCPRVVGAPTRLMRMRFDPRGPSLKRLGSARHGLEPGHAHHWACTETMLHWMKP